MKTKKFIFSLIIFFCFFLVSANCVNSAEMSENIKKGLMKMSMDRLDEAQSYFEREQQSNPKNGLAYYYTGEIYYRKADFSKALEYYQKAIEIEPANSAYHLGAGMAYLSLGQNDKAIEEFQVVISSDPGTYQAKQAELQLNMLKNTNKNTDVVKKWQSAEKAAQAGAITKKEETIQTPTLVQQAIPVETVVKDLRFGTLTKRKEASKLLYSFPSTQIEPFLQQFISCINKEKDDEIKKNVLLVIGKVQTKEASEYLFGVIDSPDYLFDTKMVALQALSESLNPDVAEKLKDILDNMVTKKLRMREEAKAKIESIEKTIDDLDVQRITLESDRAKIQARLQEINGKLMIQPFEMSVFGPGTVPPGAAGLPGAPPPAPETTVETLSPEQIKQLRAEVKKIEAEIKAKDRQLDRIKTQIAKLQEEKTKNEAILVKKYGTGTVKVIGAVGTQPSQQSVVNLPTPEMPGMPGGTPGMPQMPGVPSQPTFTAGPEEEQEQALALSIVKILGKFGKPDYMPVIEKAWEEYKADSFELEYGLVRAQLGFYEYMDSLVERLREDYPSSADPNEIAFRADIVKVIGNYLSQHENQDYAELLGYLAETDPNETIKTAAYQALSKVKTQQGKPSEKT